MENPSAILALASLLSALTDVLEWLLELPQTVFHGYSWLIRSAADSVHSLYDDYGYWVVFLGTLLENKLFLGLVLPGVIVVILAGLSAEDGSISVPLAVALGIAGTVTGDTISYCLGRFGWRRLGQGQAMREVCVRGAAPGPGQGHAGVGGGGARAAAAQGRALRPLLSLLRLHAPHRSGGGGLPQDALPAPGASRLRPRGALGRGLHGHRLRPGSAGADPGLHRPLVPRNRVGAARRRPRRRLPRLPDGPALLAGGPPYG